MDDLFSAEPEPVARPSHKPAPAQPAAPPRPAPVQPQAAPSAAASALDDILASASAAGSQAAPAQAKRQPPEPVSAPSPSSSLDELLGLGPSSKSAPVQTEPEPSSLDAIFGSASPSKTGRPAMPIQETSSVSLDDILGIGGKSKTESKPAPAAPPAFQAETVAGGTDDLLDSILNLGGEPKGGGDIPAVKAPRHAPEDPLAGLGFTGDETIIDPSVQLEAQAPAASGSAPNLGAFGSPQADETIPGAAMAAPPGGSVNGEGLLQTFEDDAIGQRPKGWEGDYPYATLTVENKTPPNGSKNYLVYKKKEGVGKVYYSTKFPNLSGIVRVEFDLRCDDKNKFLLGFYIEKDEDFQQSIHTKILRSESQTAPSIHIHGQPAPYMLGQWAHIRYVIDLNEGKVDGYVDERHVARAIKLPQVPKYLNTLAIRDNINTTGQLFIDNIRVEKVV
jgi:hypothetical protein